MNIGLIGFGSMGRVHTYAVQNLPFFFADLPFTAQIKGVCTTSLEKSTFVAKKHGFAFAADNEDVLIHHPDIDVIDICTPNVFHYETIKKAISAGKHVYCEKPLCVTAEQAKDVAALAAAKGVQAQVVFNNRFLSAIQRAKELIDRGRLGKILSFRASYLHSSAANPDKPYGWKLDREICGGGTLFDLGSHVLDLIYYLCGPYKRVSGKSQIVHPVRCDAKGNPYESDADEAFYLLAELESGAVGTVEASKLTVGTNDDLTFAVYGELGAMKFDLMEPNWLWFYDNTLPEEDYGGDRGFTRIECVNRYPYPGGGFPGQKAPVGWLRGHIGSMYAFLHAVHSGTPTAPSFDDGAHIQCVMEAAYRSAASGQWVGVE